jgi:hypothetical protein
MPAGLAEALAGAGCEPELLDGVDATSELPSMSELCSAIG